MTILAFRCFRNNHQELVTYALNQLLAFGPELNRVMRDCTEYLESTGSYDVVTYLGAYQAKHEMSLTAMSMAA